MTKEIDLNSLEIENINFSDYPDFSDAIIVSGYYKDGTEIDDDTLFQLACEGVACEQIHERQLWL